jgi:hypothetical protein
MKNLIALIITIFAAKAFASEPNFKCEIFGGIDGSSTSGSLTLTGDSPFTQTYDLEIGEFGSTQKKHFSGSLYLSKSVPFNDLERRIQDSIIRAISTKAGLTTGSSILFTNTQNSAESTLNVFLMPSGQISYLQIGALEALCM